MEHDPLRLDPRKLMWRTRGATWDFQFVLWPKELQASWLDAFERIFPEGQAPRRGIEYRRGRLVLAGTDPAAAPTFHAAALTDPARTDSSGRPIQQFFVYVGGPEAELVARDWAPGLLTALAPAYDAVFSLRRQQGESGEQFSVRLWSILGDRLPAELVVAADSPVPPRSLEMGPLVLPDRSAPPPPRSEPVEAPKPDGTRGPATLPPWTPSGVLGSFARGAQRLLGIPRSGPKEELIAELVAELADQEGPEAARRLLERLLKDLKKRR